MFSMSRRRAVVLLALSSILLITLDLQGNAVVDGVRRAFGTVFQPLQDAGRVITRPIGNAWRGITEYDDLRAENERLQDRIDQQEGAFIAALATVRDAQELLALNGIDDLTDISSITAQVVGESPTNFSQTVEINQGSSDGLRVGMPVVNAAGLVGKVTEVFANRSIVMLATDVSYAIPVQVLNLPEPEPVATATTTTTTSLAPTTTTSLAPTTTTTTLAPATATPVAIGPTSATTVAPSPSTSVAPVVTSISPVLTVAPPTMTPTPSSVVDINALPTAETGAFRGRGPDRAPIVEFVDQSSRFGEIKVGAVVITAGGSKSLAPRGIVIGRVVEVVERSGTAGAVLEVRLAARLSTLNFVRVLLYQPAVSR